MTELEKLDRYLTDHKYPHTKNCLPYFDDDGILITSEFNQIIVFRPMNLPAAFPHLELHSASIENPVGMERWFDVACVPNTYGYDEGLLESSGTLFGEEVYIAGNLTADNIIKRLEDYRREVE